MTSDFFFCISRSNLQLQSEKKLWNAHIEDFFQNSNLRCKHYGRYKTVENKNPISHSIEKYLENLNFHAISSQLPGKQSLTTIFCVRFRLRIINFDHITICIHTINIEFIIILKSITYIKGSRLNFIIFIEFLYIYPVKSMLNSGLFFILNHSKESDYYQ